MYTSQSITASKKTISISPSQGSIHGGTVVTLTGYAYQPNDMRAELYQQGAVEIISVDLCEAKLRMPAFNTTVDSAQTIRMYKLDGPHHSNIKYTYMLSLSPVITGATPAVAKSGDSVTFAGTFLGSSDADYTVTIGDAGCVVTSSSASSIVCTVQEHPAGSHKAIIHNKGVIAEPIFTIEPV